MPASSESEEGIDTPDSPLKFPRTHDIDNIGPSTGYLSPEIDERTEAVTKAWLDNGEKRPRKKLRIATGQNIPDLARMPDVSPRTPAKNVFGTQGPRVFSTQAKKEIKNAFVYAIAPPPASELLSSLESHGLPSRIYQDPYYSKAEDVPERPWEFAGLVYRLKKGDGLSVLEEWEPSSAVEPLQKNPLSEDRNVFEDRFDRTGVSGWEYASAPPSVREVRKWLTSTTRAQPCEKLQARSQASGEDNSS